MKVLNLILLIAVFVAVFIIVTIKPIKSFEQSVSLLGKLAVDSDNNDGAIYYFNGYYYFHFDQNNISKEDSLLVLKLKGLCDYYSPGVVYIEFHNYIDPNKIKP